MFKFWQVFGWWKERKRWRERNRMERIAREARIEYLNHLVVVRILRHAEYWTAKTKKLHLLTSDSLSAEKAKFVKACRIANHLHRLKRLQSKAFKELKKLQGIEKAA